MNHQFLLTLIMFLISWPLLAQDLEKIISKQLSEAQGIHEIWIKAQSKGVTKKDIFEGQAERADYIISGIPKFVKSYNPRGITFRHYTGKATQIVVDTHQLKTGITPYVVMNPGYSREVYEDLVGIFLTTPQTPPERVGLPRNPNADYIDFTLYEGTPVVEIEKEILLIPGRPDVPAWIKTLYDDYKKTGRYNSHYLELFKKIDSRGGIYPTYMKIKIIKYRKDGKTVTL